MSVSPPRNAQRAEYSQYRCSNCAVTGAHEIHQGDCVEMYRNTASLCCAPQLLTRQIVFTSITKRQGAGGGGAYTRKLTRERQRANQGVRLNNFRRNRAKLLCASQTTSFLSNYYPPPRCDRQNVFYCNIGQKESFLLKHL